jgi:hypothetical protein
MSNGTYTCTGCGGDQIEICLPAFFEANTANFDHVSTDYEASALSWYCRDCEDTVAVNTASGDIDAGRWNASYPND